MDPRLQEMLDHYEITKVLNEYCHGCDRCDQVAMASVYCDDSWDDHGHRSGRGADFAQIIMEGMRENNGCSHLQGQTMIRVEGDGAGAETYFLAVVRSKGDDGREIVSQLGGRYVDRLAREGAQWKIKHRTCVRDWSITLPVEVDWLAAQGLTEGGRTNDDPSWAALGRTHSGIPDFSSVGK